MTVLIVVNTSQTCGYATRAAAESKMTPKPQNAILYPYSMLIHTELPLHMLAATCFKMQDLKVKKNFKPALA